LSYNIYSLCICLLSVGVAVNFGAYVVNEWASCARKTCSNFYSSWLQNFCQKLSPILSSSKRSWLADNCRWTVDEASIDVGMLDVEFVCYSVD